MKRWKMYILMLLLSTMSAWLLLAPEPAVLQNDNAQQDKPRKGPELEKWYFEQWHQPYGAVLPEPVYNRIMSEIKKHPAEPSAPVESAADGWMSLGPHGMSVPNSNAVYSGRVLDIDVHSNGQVLAAAASGGLWRIDGNNNTPISDAATSLAVSSVTTNPADPNLIYIATGEPNIRNGSGIWFTGDGGDNWSQSIPLDPAPSAFYRIRFAASNTTGYFLHAVSNQGYYRSPAGFVWTRVLDGNTTDLAIDPSNNNIMYTVRWGDDFIWKTFDGGANWLPFSMLLTTGSSLSNTGRKSLAISASNPDIIYMAVAKNDSNTTHGVYRSENGGVTWSDISPPGNFMGNQGWYNNTIVVNPNNPNVVLVGGVQLLRTNNGGTSWTEVSDLNVHVDHHALTWVPGTNDLYNGNDGGVSFSPDGGSTSWFTDELNNMAITQYVNIDVCATDFNIIDGGSQDNGHSLTTDGGATWTYSIGGDGGGIAIDPADCSRMWITNGVYGNDWAFNRLRSTNSGGNWSFINNGVDPSDQWYNKIRHDQYPPVYLYNNSGPWVYESQDGGDNWTKLNSNTPFSGNINEMTVSRWSTGGGVVYACMSGTTPGNRLWVYDNGTWYERSSPEFPANSPVRRVTPHPYNNNIAFAVMGGLDPASLGKQIWKTTDRGISWTNITGTAIAPMAGVLAHPTDDNILYLATEYGIWRTTDGGTIWLPWNMGMPLFTIVTELKFVDQLNTNGRFYIVAGTYGRGTYLREINDNPLSIDEEESQLAEAFELHQNYPNPFNPTTTIAFSLPRSQEVELKVFDINGRSVATLINGYTAAGDHQLEFNAADLASGVYFYRIATPQFTKTRRMVLVK